MKEEKKKITLTIIGILLIACVLLGISYAVWVITHTQESTNMITTDCFKIEFTDENPISLTKAYPMRDNEGMELTPYTFTLKNTCSGNASFQVNLETLEQASGTKVLKDEYVKVNISEGDSSLLTEKLGDNLQTATTITNAKNAYKLYTGILKANETKVYNVRLWMDEGVTIENEDAMNANFEGKVTIIASYLNELPKTATETLAELAESSEELIYDGTVDNNLRYIGANPNNYVRFNNELWRIIGVMNDVEDENGTVEPRIKLIRNESLGDMPWDYKQTGVGSSTTDYGSNDWSDSQLMMMLNPSNRIKNEYTVDSDGYVTSGEIKLFKTPGSYYNKTSGYKPASATTTAFTETAIDFSSTGLTSEAKEMIQPVKWKLGGTASYDSSSNGLASDWYSYERGTTVYSGRPTEWIGEIGLMYPSDYGYATSGGSTTNRETCLAKELYNWDSSSVSDCKNNDWLKPRSDYTWTLSPSSFNANAVFLVNLSGFVGSSTAHDSYGVRPVLYLTSDTMIESGEGSLEKPYILKRV